MSEVDALGLVGVILFRCEEVQKGRELQQFFNHLIQSLHLKRSWCCRGFVAASGDKYCTFTNISNEGYLKVKLYLQLRVRIIAMCVHVIMQKNVD